MNEASSIMPATKLTDTQSICIQENVTKNECLFVFHEPGKWDAIKQLRKLFDARHDGTGYLVDMKHKDKLEAFCSKYDLFQIPHPAPENIDALPYYDEIALFEDKREAKEYALENILKDADITYSSFESLHTEAKREQIKKSPAAEKISPLLREHKVLCDKIKWLLNQKKVSSIKSDTLLSLNDEYQEELLTYLFKTPFLKLIEDGFNPISVEPNVFSGLYRSIVEGIKIAWENGDSVSPAQVALNVNNDSKSLYRILNNISERPLINKNQAEQRIKHINEHRAANQLNALKDTIELGIKQNLPHHEIAEIIRNELNDVQSVSKKIFPQSHHLHHLVEEINNPINLAISTGIPSLDLLLSNGFKKTELGVLAGGAGSGKTAFALQVADSIAEKGGIVIYVSIEIGKVKLTERSLKRLSYCQLNKTMLNDCYSTAVTKYMKFASNIYLYKGHHGMQVSEIKGIVLDVVSQHRDKNLLLIIDPFQRLGTGNEKIDYNNETIKVGILCSQIKDMTETLKIPILALSDTVKDHKNNKSGEGASRGTYMIDHTADFVMLLRTSINPLIALYGEENPEDKDDPFMEEIKVRLKKGIYTNTNGDYALHNRLDRYAGLITSKNRDGIKRNLLFVYKPYAHLFIDTNLWNGIKN